MCVHMRACMCSVLKETEMSFPFFLIIENTYNKRNKILQITFHIDHLIQTLSYPSYTVTGKSQIWLHVGSVSFTLTFAFCCFCSLKGYSLYLMACLWEPCPSAWMLNQSAFVQRNIRNLSACGWLQERRN